MQTHYAKMMEQTQALIARASEISDSAEAVTKMLRQHKADVLAIQEMIAGRFDAVRKILQDDEENFRDRLNTILNEMDEAIRLINGPPVEPPANPPTPSAEDVGNATFTPGEPVNVQI